MAFETVDGVVVWTAGGRGDGEDVAAGGAD